MRMKSKLVVGLIALFVLFGILINQPVIHIPRGFVSGVPAVLFYLFIVWIIIIALMWWMTTKGSEKEK